MDLPLIVDRYAEMLAHVDATTAVIGVNRRTRQPYQPGIQPMTESVVVPLVDATWETRRAGERQLHRTEVAYPTKDVPQRTTLDHVITADGQLEGAPEWGIELKRLEFAGDNGKNGDHETAKMLSPYLKDRGILHDALRLRQYGWTRLVAVVGFGFNYDQSSLRRAAALHTGGQAAATVKNIAALVKRNGPLNFGPLIEFTDAILRLRRWTIGPRAEAAFQAWRHPSGGTGVVFGWEIHRP